MRNETVEILRCPYCGGRLRVREDLPCRRERDDILDAVLACHCMRFPIVDGIAVLTFEGVAEPAREQSERGEFDAALRTMFAAGEDDMAAAYDRISRHSAPTYRDAVEAMGSAFEEGLYFLYRFSDPTFIASDAVVRALGQVVLREGGRAIDLCGGSGHLTRTLQAFTPSAVIVDWSFQKLWLARRFTAPGCDAVCADVQTAMPFAAGAFRLAVCSDAFHYLWTKALMAHEMARLVDGSGVVAITHTHNSLQRNLAPGIPLPPQAYREMFESFGGRVFADARLLDEALQGFVDLSGHDEDDALRHAHSLTIVAAGRQDVFAKHTLAPMPDRGRLHINPMYRISRNGDGARLTLTFPDAEYEEEYAAIHGYLPSELTVPRATLDAIERDDDTALRDLIARRVVLRLPERWV